MNNEITTTRKYEGVYQLTIDVYGITIEVEDLRRYGRTFVTEQGHNYTLNKWEVKCLDNDEMGSLCFDTFQDAKYYLQNTFNPSYFNGFTLN